MKPVAKMIESNGSDLPSSKKISLSAMLLSPGNTYTEQIILLTLLISNCITQIEYSSLLAGLNTFFISTTSINLPIYKY